MARREREPRRGLPPDPDDNWNVEELDWEESADKCDELWQKIEDAPAGVWDKAFEFFESIQEKVKNIGESIRKYKKATQNQMDAIENMESGVDKWLENDDE